MPLDLDKLQQAVNKRLALKSGGTAPQPAVSPEPPAFNLSGGPEVQTVSPLPAGNVQPAANPLPQPPSQRNAVSSLQPPARSVQPALPQRETAPAPLRPEMVAKGVELIRASRALEWQQPPAEDKPEYFTQRGTDLSSVAADLDPLGGAPKVSQPKTVGEAVGQWWDETKSGVSNLLNPVAQIKRIAGTPGALARGGAALAEKAGIIDPETAAGVAGATDSLNPTLPSPIQVQAATGSLTTGQAVSSGIRSLTHGIAIPAVTTAITGGVGLLAGATTGVGMYNLDNAMMAQAADIAAGKSPREIAEAVYDTAGTKEGIVGNVLAAASGGLTAKFGHFFAGQKQAILQATRGLRFADEITAIQARAAAAKAVAGELLKNLGLNISSAAVETSGNLMARGIMPGTPEFNSQFLESLKTTGPAIAIGTLLGAAGTRSRAPGLGGSVEGIEGGRRPTAAPSPQFDPTTAPIQSVKRVTARDPVTDTLHLDVDATAAALPPVPAGHTRLFRGQHPEAQTDAYRPGTFEGHDAGSGGYFTSDLNYADMHRQQQGRGAQLVYMDVPDAVAEAHAFKNNPDLVSRNQLASATEPSYYFPQLRKKGGDSIGQGNEGRETRQGEGLLNPDLEASQTQPAAGGASPPTTGPARRTPLARMREYATELPANRSDDAGQMLGFDESYSNTELVAARHDLQAQIDAGQERFKAAPDTASKMKVYEELGPLKQEAQTLSHALFVRGKETQEAAGIEPTHGAELMGSPAGKGYLERSGRTPAQLEEFRTRMREGVDSTRFDPETGRPETVASHLGIPIPPALRRTASAASELGRDAAGEGAAHLYDQTIGDFAEYVRTAGARKGRKTTAGIPSGQPGSIAHLAHRAIRSAIDTAGEIRGKISGERAEVLKTVNAGDNPRWLMTLDTLPGGTVSMGRTRQVVEGKYPGVIPDGVQRQVVPAARKFIIKRGQLAEAEGVQQMDRATGQPKLFQDRGDGKVVPRVMTNDGFSSVEAGPRGKYWDQIVDAFTLVNPSRTRQDVEGILTSMHEEMQSSNPKLSAGETLSGKGKAAAFEFSRELEEVPDVIHVKDPNGATRDLTMFEYRPYALFDRMAEQGAMRLGVVRAIGQDIGNTNPTQDLLRDYAEETGDATPLAEAYRALHGQPVENPFTEPGSAINAGMRGIGHLTNVVKALNLSGSFVANSVETVLGNAQAFGTWKDFYNTVKEYYGDPHGVARSLEALGAATPDVVDWSVDPVHLVASYSKNLREGVLKLTLNKFLNELTEHGVGAMRRTQTRRYKAGGGTAEDVSALMMGGYPRQTARRMVAGKGTNSEYDSFIRQGGFQESGSPAFPAQLTRIEHNRVFKAATAFTRYFVRTWQRTYGVLKTNYDEFQRVQGDPALTNNQKIKELLPTFKVTAKYFGIKVAQGAAAQMLMAYFTGGALGLDTKIAEFKDRPIGFMKDALTYSLLGGPIGAALSVLGDTGTLADSIYPVSVVKQITQAMTGTGSYTNQSFGERMVNLAVKMAPISRTIAQIASVAGYNDGKHEFDTAMRAYWRWQHDTRKLGKDEQDALEGDDLAFRKSMQAFEQAALNKDMVGRRKALRAALGASAKAGDAKVKNSLRARRVLTAARLGASGGEDGRDLRLKQIALRERVGQKAYRVLENHDRLLESLADSL